MKLFSLVITLLLTCPVYTQSPIEVITEKLEAAFQKSKLPGFAVAMVSKDKVLYQKGFGYADVASKKSYTTHTVQNIGSISKTLIGLSLMKAVEADQLKLDDPINKYLPFKVVHSYHPEAVITIRQLATHTSGIQDRASNYNLKSYYIDDTVAGKDFSKKGFSIFERWYLNKVKKNKLLSLEDYLSNVFSEKGKWNKKKNFRKTAPGEAYHYSNIGAALAAFILERATGVPYDEYTRNQIIKPLKMQATGWKYKDVDLEKFATRYQGKKRGVVPFYGLSTYPDGSLKTSISDMALYLKEMLKGYEGESDLLSKASFDELFLNQLPTSLGNQSGIFWEIFGMNKDGDIGHGGGDPGITTIMFFSPTTKIGKIIMTNSSGNGSDIFMIWEEFIKMEDQFLNE